MKRNLLLLLMLLLGIFQLIAGPVKLLSDPNSVIIFDEFGKNVPSATELNLSWSAFAKEEKASFSSPYGNFEIDPQSAITIGADDFETYINLLNGTIHVNNTSSYEIIIYTPVSKVSVNPKTELIAISTQEIEDFSVLDGSIEIYDSITGQTKTLPVVLASSEEVSQKTVEVVPEVIVFVEEPEPVAIEPEVAEPVLTTVGKGYDFGLKAHILVPKLNMDVLSPENARRVRRSLENLDYSLAFTFSYNSLKLGVRLDPVNTKKDNLDISSSDNPYRSLLGLVGSSIDHINYGSKGTVFHLRADRNTDIDFVHPMFGQMDHQVSENRELGLFSEIKTDHFEMMVFADNLSLRDNRKENAGLRISSRPSNSSSFEAGLSILATNNVKDFSEFLAFPSLDMSFNAYQNSKKKAELRFLGSLSLENTNSFVIGSEMDFSTDLLTATAGVAVNKGSYLSHSVDYGNDAYEIYKLGAKAPIVNLYAKANFKYENYFGSLYANLPFDFESGTSLNDKIDRNFSIKGGTTLGQTNLWAAVKITNPKSVEKLSIGADFDFDFAFLDFELGYDENMDNPIFITTCLSIEVDKKIIKD